MTLTIVHTFGRNAGATLTFDKEVVRFGRAPTNEVTFDPDYDRDASAMHAEIRREGADWLVVDLGSRNGTFVAGRRVSKQAICSGDEITFGSKGPRVRVSFGESSASFANPNEPSLRRSDVHPQQGGGPRGATRLRHVTGRRRRSRPFRGEPRSTESKRRSRVLQDRARVSGWDSGPSRCSSARPWLLQGRELRRNEHARTG